MNAARASRGGRTAASRRRGAAAVAGVSLLALATGGCASRPSRPPPQPWAQPAPAPWSAPGGAGWGVGAVAETRDPWWAAAPSSSPAAGRVDDSFLVVLDLRGPAAAARLPDAHATLARLGGVQRTPPVWEVASQPGGGLAALAAVLERELCAEDLVIVYRARPTGLERSEFAGHRACRPDVATSAPPSAGSAPAAAPPAARRDPFYDRF